MILSKDDALARGDDPASSFAVEARSDGGVQCVVCGGIMAFDARLNKIRRIDTSGPTQIAVASDGDQSAATLRRLDPIGNVVWSHTITAMNDGLLLIQGAVATADGGMIILVLL